MDKEARMRRYQKQYQESTKDEIIEDLINTEANADSIAEDRDMFKELYEKLFIESEEKDRIIERLEGLIVRMGGNAKIRVSDASINSSKDSDTISEEEDVRDEMYNILYKPL